MKLIFRYFALAVVGALMSGCAEEVEVVQPAVNGTVMMKTTISLDGKSATRALTEAGVKTFAAGDQIAVIYEQGTGTGKAVSVALTAADIDATDAHKATFSVALTNPKANGKVRYIYPASMAADDVSTTTPDNAATINYTALASQDGTFASLASTYDLAVYDGTMGATATLPTGTGVELKNQLSIVKLATITDGTNDMRANITDLTIDDGTNTYIISRTAEDAPIFVAMLPTNGDITFSTVIGGFPYTKTATGKTLAKNKIYPINLAMVQDMRATPLTFEAKAANATVTFDILTGVATNPVYYRQHNSTAWTDWALYTDNTAITLTNIGDIVQFKAENATYYDTGTNGSRIKCGADCYAYGNIMSLTDGDNFYTADELKASYTFKYLFVDNFHLQIDALRPLLLPATKLTAHCYEDMFNNCKALTVLPALPANELKDKCYFNMFSGCGQLTTVPEGYLPATQLAAYCYSGMFNGCTNLATVPTNLLPAETLAEYCYGYMFNDCSNLTVAPVLPAKTLVSGCYNNIFGTCTKLGSVTCLATNIYASNCLLNWLTRAGTAADCEPKVYVDPSMLNPATDIWNLDNSGTDGKRWTATTNDYAHLTTANIGHVLAADGNIYTNAASATTAGTTAEAVIAYVGSVPNYFDHFLAIAIDDVDGNTHTWADAHTKVGEYAGTHGITIGGTNHNTNAIGATYYDQVASNEATTSATRTAGIVKGWRLPSVTDWRYIFDGIGRIKNGVTLTAKHSSGTPVYSSNATPTDPLGVVDGMYYYKNNDAAGNSTLLAKINEACGNTALQSDYYWSSSEYTNDSNFVWHYYFYKGILWWNSKSINDYVRAVFAY